MKQMGQLLELVDKPGKPKGYRSRQLKFTMADTLAPKIKTLAEQIGTVSVTVSAAVKQAPTASRGGTTRDPKTGRVIRKPPTTSKPPTKRTTTTAPKQAADTVYLEADARTNRILMIGHEKQLTIVESLIDSLDVEQQDLRLLRLYEIRNVDAEEVRLKLEELGIVTTQTRTTSRRQSSRDPRRQPGSRTPGGGTAQKGATQATRRITGNTMAQTASNEEPLAGEPQVVILETVNSLLVNATPEQHVRIAMIIGYVDSEPEDTVIPYVVYPLENQDPEQLAEVLNQLIQETTTNQDQAGKIQKTVERRTDDEIIIIADKNTFSLIVYASKRNQTWIETLITQLDKRRPQVMIDATLVQITKDDEFNFDLNVIQAVPDLTVVTDKVFDPLQVVLPPGVTGDGRNHFLEFNYDTGQGFYADEHINALLTAMATKRYGRIMARPKLTVNDNETGVISTVDTTYVERTTTNVIGTDNPTSTQSTQFDDYSAGITMEITPHISEGDMLRLEITLNRSGFTSPLGVSLIKPPNKSDADVSTIVTVPDRSTIILGGLEKVENSKGGSKIPILGDLPLIGGLFREIEKKEGHDKLYVFVKAHILRPGGENALADFKEVSRRNRETFEQLEAEMQEYDDWPGIEAEPMNPARVLEAD